MTKKYLAFDLEIATPIPAGATDWNEYRPFGIACAATWASDMSVPILWAAAGNSQHMFRDEIGPVVAADLLVYLRTAAAQGYTLVTFNGAGFDFNVLSEELRKYGHHRLASDCPALARNHIDIFFHIFCAKGYAKGLDTIARGMGLAGKPEGVNGALAPQMWVDGRYHEVLDYCAQDARTTLDIAHLIDQRRFVQWESRSGETDKTDMPDGCLTVEQALQLPEPDVSWMDDPWSRDKFVGWLSGTNQ